MQRHLLAEVTIRRKLVNRRQVALSLLNWGIGENAMQQFAAVIVPVLAACVPAQAQIIGVQDVEMVARLTGADSINRTDTVGIGGTDLGQMVNHDGKTYFLFGDTCSAELPKDGGCWRSNVMAYSTDTTPSDGIVFDGWITGSSVCGHSEWAREVIAADPSSAEKILTEIPTGAVSIGNRIYAWFLSLNSWGMLDVWFANYCGLAYWEVGDPTFTVVPEFRIPPNSNFCQVVPSLRTDLGPGEDDYIYLWGTTAGRVGGVKLARVLPDAVTDLRVYQYYAGLDEAGQPTWSADEFSCPLIVPSPVGEMSVMYNQAASSWTMMYLNANSKAIELRQAPKPWGPWSSPLTVVTGAQFPGSYGSYMNPLYVEQDGEVVYFIMSLWDPYDVYLMKARLTVAPDGCGRGVGLGNLTFFWTVCLMGLVALKARNRRSAV